MKIQSDLTRIIAVFFTFGLGCMAAFAQDVHLGVLSEWLARMEEATKYVDQGDYIKAEQRLNLAIKEIRPYFPDTQRNLARSYCELARVLYHQGRYKEAEPLVRWALTIRELDTNAKPGAVFQCVYTLGLIQAAQKKHAEAEQFLKRSLALQDQSLGPDHANSAVILSRLALVCSEQLKYTEAESFYLRSIAIDEQRAANENLDLADTAGKYAELLDRMKSPRRCEAMAHLRHAQFATESRPRRPKPGPRNSKRRPGRGPSSSRRTFADSSSPSRIGYRESMIWDTCRRTFSRDGRNHRTDPRIPGVVMPTVRCST